MRRIALVIALAAARVAPAAEAPPKEPEKIAAAVRKEVAFAIAAGEGSHYGLTRVQRNGTELPAPANMKLDPKTGAFTWTPTPSQAGDYEIHFLIKAPTGETTRATRRVAVEARDIRFNKGWLDDLGGADGLRVSQDLQRLAVVPSRPDAFVLTDDYCPMDSLRADEALRWRELAARTIGSQGIF